MANIDDIMAEDLAATAFDTDAVESPCETIEYTADGAEAVEIQAIIETMPTDIRDDESRQDLMKGSSWIIKASDITTITSNDLITFDDITYQVYAWEKLGPLWRVRAMAIIYQRRSAPNSYELRSK